MCERKSYFIIAIGRTESLASREARYGTAPKCNYQPGDGILVHGFNILYEGDFVRLLQLGAAVAIIEKPKICLTKIIRPVLGQ